MSGDKDCICGDQEAVNRYGFNTKCPVHNESDDKLRVYTNKIGEGLVNYVDFATYLKLEKENAELKAALGECLDLLDDLWIEYGGRRIREVLARLKKRWGRS